MSSTIDPAKLKVVDLRSELSARGLDTKGNKAALVKRLKDALEQELKQDLPDTSIADTSTEDLDTSQSEEQSQESAEKDNVTPTASEVMEVDEEKPEDEQIKLSQTTDDTKNSERDAIKGVSKPATDEVKDDKEELKDNKQENVDENGEHSDQQTENTSQSDEQKASEEADDQKVSDDKKQDVSKSTDDSDQKGEKRRRTSTSPERSQRRRSRSPVREEEPELDNDKVQLSWYDSDLHLELDKESFLSAKPFTEWSFGFAWAGVRATHGVSAGKVCYEVKVTEELKWDDFSIKYPPRNDRRYRTDHRKNQKRDKDKNDPEGKPSEKPKSENGEVKTEKSEEQPEKDPEEKPETATEEKPEKDSEEKPEKTDEAEKPAETNEVLPEEKEKSSETVDEPQKIEKMDDDTAEQPKEKENEPEKSEDKAKDDEAQEKQEATEEKSETEENKAKAPVEPLPSHLVRVGWSMVSSNLQLGEDKYSYGYESTGKFVADKQFADYGIKFGVGDVVGAFLEITDENVIITYTVNGQIQPVAATLPKADFPEENFSLFPHVLTRNCAFECNLGDREEPWFPAPAELDGYVFLSKVEDKTSGPTRPETRGECEVILMCGLPGSGKTRWVKNHIASNPEKRYTVLGNASFLERMTVSGEPLKKNFKGRWTLLVDRAQKCLNKLLEIGSTRRRNIIIDQTNVFPSAQRRKLRPFEGFKRHAVIVVVGDEEHARRLSLQEAQDGKEVPDSTILEMKADMTLPQKCEWLEEVTYAELGESEAKEIVKKYNTTARAAGYGDINFGRNYDRWQNRRNDHRGKGFRERSYYNQRYDPRNPRQGGWNNQRSGGSNWNRDRRNNRGPPVREWRGSGRDRGSRDGHNQGGNYNRNRHQGGGGRGHGNWSGGNWNSQGWNQQTFGSGSGGYAANQNWNNQWKYGGGSGGGSAGGQQGYGSGYSNWNYYNQYGQQNWNSQK